MRRAAQIKRLHEDNKATSKMRCEHTQQVTENTQNSLISCKNQQHGGPEPPLVSQIYITYKNNHCRYKENNDRTKTTENHNIEWQRTEEE